MATAGISAPRSAAAPTDLAYLRQIAQAADQLGYFGVLLPTGKSCEDSWIVASALLAVDRAAALPGGGQAGPAAADGRGAHDRDARPHLGRPPADQRRHRRRPGREQGRRHLPQPRRALRDHARVPARLQGAARRRDGRRRRASTSAVEGGQLLFPPVQAPHPPLYFGGSSEAGIDVAAEHGRQVSDLGRAAGAGRREDRDRSRAAAGSTGPHAQLRHPPARHRARNRRRRPGRRPTG